MDQLRLSNLTQNQIKDSLSVKPLLDAAADFLHFVTEFFEVISQSAPHIYHSALQLSPQSSIVRKLYGQQISSPVARVVTGIPESWDSCVASTAVKVKDCCAVWSPCGNFIAVSTVGGAEIRDPNTLERLSVLELSDAGSAVGSLAFSPNGHLLACTHGHDYRYVYGQRGGLPPSYFP